MRVAPLLALCTMACASGEIVVTPPAVDFGEVDFNQPRPDTGYDPRSVEIENVGSGSLDVFLLGIDRDHILVGGQFADTDPPLLQTLEPGSSAVITLGAWGYLPGEWDNEVTGSVRLSASGLPDDVAVDWSFTPVRIIDE
jgi:hypothetical protein